MVDSKKTDNNQTPRPRPGETEQRQIIKEEGNPLRQPEGQPGSPAQRPDILQKREKGG